MSLRRTKYKRLRHQITICCVRGYWDRDFRWYLHHFQSGSFQSVKHKYITLHQPDICTNDLTDACKDLPGTLIENFNYPYFRIFVAEVWKNEQLKFTINVNDKKWLFYHQNFIFEIFYPKFQFSGIFGIFFSVFANFCQTVLDLKYVIAIWGRVWGSRGSILLCGR